MSVVKPDLEMAWLVEKPLTISYPEDARVFMEDSDVQRVKVEFNER